jgi:hypothetical protein
MISRCVITVLDWAAWIALLVVPAWALFYALGVIS